MKQIIIFQLHLFSESDEHSECFSDQRWRSCLERTIWHQLSHIEVGCCNRWDPGSSPLVGLQGRCGYILNTWDTVTITKWNHFWWRHNKKQKDKGYLGIIWGSLCSISGYSVPKFLLLGFSLLWKWKEAGIPSLTFQKVEYGTCFKLGQSDDIQPSTLNLEGVVCINTQENDRFLWASVADVQQWRHNVTLIRLPGCVVILTMCVLTSCLPSLMPQVTLFAAEVTWCWSHAVLVSAARNQEPRERIRQLQVCARRYRVCSQEETELVSLVRDRRPLTDCDSKWGQLKVIHGVEFATLVPPWWLYSGVPGTMFGRKGRTVKLAVSHCVYFYLSPNWMVVYGVYFNRFYVTSKL